MTSRRPKAPKAPKAPKPPKQPVVYQPDSNTSDDSIRELFRFPYNTSSDDEATSEVPVSPDSGGNAQQGEAGETSGAAQEGASDAAVDYEADEDLPKLKYNGVYRRQGGNKYEARLSDPDEKRLQYLGLFKRVKVAARVADLGALKMDLHLKTDKRGKPRHVLNFPLESYDADIMARINSTESKKEFFDYLKGLGQDDCQN